MKRFTAFLSMAICLAPCAALAGSPDSQESAALAGTVRDNRVELIFGPDVRDLRFEYAEGHATAEGAMQGADSELQEDRLVVHVHAERSGSEAMAQEWFERLGNDDRRMIGSRVFSEDTRRPEKLNFWVRGKLWINGEPVEGGFFLGQGHRMFTNNWWVGSPEGLADASWPEFRLPQAGATSYCIRPASANMFLVGTCRWPAQGGA